MRGILRSFKTLSLSYNEKNLWYICLLAQVSLIECWVFLHITQWSRKAQIVELTLGNYAKLIRHQFVRCRNSGSNTSCQLSNAVPLLNPLLEQIKVYLKVWILVLVNTRRNKHWSSLHNFTIQPKSLESRFLILEFYIAVAPERPLVTEHRADLLYLPAALKKLLQFHFGFCHVIGKVADKDGNVIFTAVVQNFGDVFATGGCLLLLVCWPIWFVSSTSSKQPSF